MTRRRRLAMDRAWPVRGASLQEALGPEWDQVNVAWVTWDQRSLGAPLSATWTPRSDGIGAWPEEEGLTVWVRPVARVERHAAAELVESSVLPDLASWVRHALGASPVWRGTRHERLWSLNAGLVSVRDVDGLRVLERD